MVWVRACHLDVSRQVIRAPRTDCTGKLQPFQPGQIILNPGGHGERAGVIVVVEDIAPHVGIRAILAQRERQGRRGAVGYDGVARRGRWPARESNTTTNGEWNEFSASYDADHSLFSPFVVVLRHRHRRRAALVDVGFLVPPRRGQTEVALGDGRQPVVALRSQVDGRAPVILPPEAHRTRRAQPDSLVIHAHRQRFVASPPSALSVRPAVRVRLWPLAWQVVSDTIIPH